MSFNCQICKSPYEEKLSLGNFKLSHSFNEKLEINNNVNFNYQLACCNKCNYTWLTQKHPILLDSYKKGFDLRIKSNEPEKHFSLLGEWISKDLKESKKNYIGILTYKDFSLSKMLFPNNKISQVFLDTDLLEISKNIIENDYRQKLLKNSLFKFDFLIARHIFEHVFNPIQFLKLLSNMINHNGIIYLELPSPLNIFKKGLSHLIWEEHYSYFSIKSLKKIFTNLNLKYYFNIFENDQEPIISVLLSKNKLNLESNINLINDSNFSLNKMYQKHSRNKNKLHKYFSNNSREKYFLGAGHLGIKFISFFNLNKFFKYIIDDNIHKQNLYSLQSGLKVISSELIPKNAEIYHALPPDSLLKVKLSGKYDNYDLISIYELV